MFGKKKSGFKMFLFDEFPEIKKAHKQYRELVDESYKLEIKGEKSGNEKYFNLAGQATEKAASFGNTVLSKIIFDTFAPIKPSLLNTQTEKYLLNPKTNEYELVSKEKKNPSWDDVFGNDYSKLDDSKKKCLVGLVEGNLVYFLPDKYYDNRDKVEILRQQALEQYKKKKGHL